MKNLLLLVLLTLSITANTQTIAGQWVTYDDKTKERKAIIEIFEMDHLYFAKIVENFDADKNAVCNECKGSKKNKSIIGLIIIENIKRDGTEYANGTILDPETGETYNCYLDLVNENELKVRGFIGFSIFGRTQYWIRKE